MQPTPNAVRRTELAVSSVNLTEALMFQRHLDEHSDPARIIMACETVAWRVDPTGKHVDRLVREYMHALSN